MSATATKPVSLRTPAERYAHVVLRLKERGNIEWTPERVQALEKKIKFVRTQLNLHKPVAPILPTKIGEEKNGHTHFYRVMVDGRPHVFAWSQICRGLVSYCGGADKCIHCGAVRGTLEANATHACNFNGR